MPTHMFAIGEAARRSGVGIETIRYYEREGIVPKPDRAANNRRLYSIVDIGRLRFLRKCRDLGFKLIDAKTLLELSEQQGTDCQSVKKIAETHRANVQEKIAELSQLDIALRQLTENCSRGRTDCPMLKKLRLGE